MNILGTTKIKGQKGETTAVFIFADGFQVKRWKAAVKTLASKWIEEQKQEHIKNPDDEFFALQFSDGETLEITGGDDGVNVVFS